MIAAEHDAGGGQTVVIYVSDDTGGEMDAVRLFEELAADAVERASGGLVIAAMTALPLRHAQGYLAREGSGYETKAAVAVTYRRA